MQKTISLSLTLLCWMMFIQGCTCQEDRRNAWLDPKYQMIFASEEIKSPIPLKRLEIQCGTPDYVMPPDEFKKRIYCEDEKCNYYMKDFCRRIFKDKED